LSYAIATADPTVRAVRAPLVHNIIDNLKRQHRELTRITMDIVPRLEAKRVVSEAAGIVEACRR